jgi:uncharacterized membrane protein/thiol-disulfide isomerase/thioredoxin
MELEMTNKKITIMEKLKKVKLYATIILALAGIGDIWFYIYCDTSCAYLRGDIFGIDLKYIGIAYMLAIIVFAAFRQTTYVRALLAWGIGVEIYLIIYQFVEGIFCPFCLTFGAIIIIAFALNYEKPAAVRNSLFMKSIYGLGDIDLSPFFKARIPLLLIVLLAYCFIVLTFSGSPTPAYGAEQSPVPSYGSGPYELIVFTDYFCPPCQALESEMDPALNDILSRGGVKVTFIDLPIHKQTILFAKYFLYIAGTTHHFKDILHARKVLFALAKSQTIDNDDNLAKALTAQGITFNSYDLKAVYRALNQTIKTYSVRVTPTCIVKYSDSDTRKYSGTNEIRGGLAMLRATQSSNIKTKK